jgi:hypothetical protein
MLRAQPDAWSIAQPEVTLGRAVQPEHLAAPSFRYRQHTPDLLDRLAATGGTHKVSFDASCSIVPSAKLRPGLSSARSATSFFQPRILPLFRDADLRHCAR